MLWTFFLREVYFKVCLHVVNFLSIHDVYFEVCLHADANFVSTRYLFWGLFTCCELSFYTRCLFWGLFTGYELCFYAKSILKFVYMLWTFFLYTMSILRCVYMLLCLHDIYFENSDGLYVISSPNNIINRYLDTIEI